jgi:hypothetical protein
MSLKSNQHEFLDQMRRRFAQAVEDEADIRKQAKRDLDFVAGQQWDPKIEADRRNAGRPVHTHNRLGSFVAQVANEARQQKPQVRFSPVEDNDRDTAEILEGMARHIQYASRASVAYETAVEYQASCGFGFFRLLSDYCDADSFNQELKIEAVMDPFAVYGALIPAIRGQKVRDAWVLDRMTREEYKAEFGESVEFASFADDSEGWVTDNTVRIAEYWYVETTKTTLAMLGDGRIVPLEDVPEGVKPEKLRDVEQDKVKICKTNGCDILEETEWVGSTIPIFAVLGKSLIVDGEPKLFSLVRFMLAAQELINYTKSRIAEAMMTAPITPFMLAEGQAEGYEDEWASANRVLRPYLQYRPVAIGNTLAPAPHRQVYEPPIQALSQFLAQEVDDLKAISGIFDPSLGDNPNAQSGIAIQRQQQQTNTANMHFLDNLTRAHEQCGRAIAEAVPRVYDTPQTVRILGADEAPKVVKVNQAYQDESGQPVHYDLMGKYDVTVTTGRSYSTKRLETFDTLSQLIQSQPDLFPIIGDVVFRNSDMAGGDEIAERLKKMLPPNLADDKDQPQQIPPEVQQKIAQQGQMVEMLTQNLNQLKQEQESKQIEIDSRERIAAMQEKTKRSIAFANLDHSEGLELLRQELGTIKHRLDMVHQAGMKAADQQHQAEQAELGRQAAAEQAEQAAAQQDDMPQAA